MFGTALSLSAIVFTVFYYHRRKLSKKKLSSNLKKIDKLFALEEKKVAPSSKTSYIEDMIKIKLVYNPDTNEWEKLWELEK